MRQEKGGGFSRIAFVTSGFLFSRLPSGFTHKFFVFFAQLLCCERPACAILKFRASPSIQQSFIEERFLYTTHVTAGTRGAS